MRQWPVFFILLILPLVISCSRNPSLFETAQSSADAVSGDVPQGLALIPYYASVDQTFTAPSSAPPVDILVSIDNEGDIQPDLDRFIQNIPRWVTALKNRPVDFQAGVIRSTSIERGTGVYDTTLQGPNTVVSSAQADADARISANVTAIRNSTQGSDPRPFRNLFEAYQNPKNAALFRPSAIPVFLAFSDAEDTGYDTDGSTVAYFISYFLNYFKQFTPLHSWALSAFGSPAANPCAESDYPNESFIEPMAAASGGQLLRFCDADYGAHADSFARNVFSVTTALSLAAAVPSPFKVDASSVVVKVNGNGINQDPKSGYAWNGSNNSVSFPGSYLPPAGNSVEVYLEYQVP